MPPAPIRPIRNRPVVPHWPVADTVDVRRRNFRRISRRPEHRRSRQEGHQAVHRRSSQDLALTAAASSVPLFVAPTGRAVSTIRCAGEAERRRRAAPPPASPAGRCGDSTYSTGRWCSRLGQLVLGGDRMRSRAARRVCTDGRGPRSRSLRQRAVGADEDETALSAAAGSVHGSVKVPQRVSILERPRRVAAAR